jgi:ABC-type dipeptide/oligopeptide/nickel transport system permease component
VPGYLLRRLLLLGPTLLGVSIVTFLLVHWMPGDPAEILAYGITTTPALVTAKYKVKAEGTAPALSIVKEWIKELQ